MNAHAAGLTCESLPSFSSSASGEWISRDKSDLADTELLRLCAQEENSALEELTRRYQPALTRFMARLLYSREDIEEALLSVFLRVWQNAARFQGRASVKTWVYRIAINIVYDIQKKNKTRAHQAWNEQTEQAAACGDAEAEALRRLEQDAQSQALERALLRLPAPDRMLLTLYYYEQMDYEQMQAVTELSYTVLKTRLTRARRRLRQIVEAQEATQ